MSTPANHPVSGFQVGSGPRHDIGMGTIHRALPLQEGAA
jgi:hypothetical protein